MSDLIKLALELSREMQELKLMVENLQISTVQRLKNEWLTTEDVCAILNMSENSLLKLRQSNTLPHSKIGQKVFFKATDIEELLTTHYNGKAA